MKLKPGFWRDQQPERLGKKKIENKKVSNIIMEKSTSQ